MSATGRITAGLAAFCVFLVSADVLALEFVQTRVFSFVLWHHFVYVVITLGLLGFAAAGTALATSSRMARLSDRDLFVYALMGYSLSAYVATKLGARPLADVFQISPSPSIFARLAVSTLLSVAPYFFAGVVVAAGFSRFPDATGRMYVANMAGSALGCALFVLLIAPLGAHWLLVLLCLITAAPIAMMLRGEKTRPKGFAAWLAALVLLAVIPENAPFVRLVPEPHKQFGAMMGSDTVLEYTEWNPIARVDVVSSAQFPDRKHVLMDGDAHAMLFRPADAARFEFLGRKLAYQAFGPPGRVLLIGAGGGLDAIGAVLSKARHVDAVEINPTTARIVRTLYTGHLGGFFSRPDVSLHLEDGRSFVRRSTEAFDIINLFATDSFVALSIGAYMMFDNYLYTREAFEDYLSRLTPGGMLQIERWYNPAMPAESLRVVSTALEALRGLGAADPLAHLVVVLAGDGVLTIVKKSPFNPAEVSALERQARARGFELLLPRARAQAEGPAMPFAALARAFSRGEEDRFYAAFPLDVRPVSDDSPFFYQFAKVRAWHAAEATAHPYFDAIRGIWHIVALSSMLVVSTLLAVLLVLAPLATRHGAPDQARPIPLVACFAGLGAGFMLVELAFVQKLALVLGHPVYSMLVVIPAILTFAGLGGLVAGRLRRASSAACAAACAGAAVAVPITAAAIAKAGPALLGASLPVRAAACVALLAPGSFMIGLPFTLGLRSLGAATRARAWAVGVNGAASVFASVAAIAIAMSLGFTADVWLAAACYVLSAAAARALSSRSPSSLRP